MNWLFLSYLLTIVCSGYIKSAPIVVEYGYSGLAIAYRLPFNLQNSISATDYIQIIWPELMHVGALVTDIKASLLTEAGDVLESKTIATDGTLTDPVYFVNFGTDIYSGQWYEIRLLPAINPTLTLGFVQLQTVSDVFSSSRIVYDSNLAYGYYYIKTTAAPPSSLTVSVSSPDAAVMNLASKIYYLYIDITPSVSAAGGNFTIDLFYSSSHTTGSTSLMDFQIVGNCQAVAACPTCTIPSLNSCQVAESLESIQFSIGQVVAGQTIRIRTQIENPVYSSTRGIRVYWVNMVNGMVQQRGQVLNALSVTPINIVDLGTDRVYFLWGMPAFYSDTDTVGINIGVYAADSASPLTGPMNSFNVGFKIQYTSPIDATFNIHISIGATGILPGSLVHNFPSSESPTYCSYTFPQIICYNVGSFVDTELRYFVSGKAFFNSATATTVSFGDITIESVAYNDGIRVPGVSLFVPFVSAIPVPVSRSTEFLDPTGIHASTLSIRNTQVVSARDDNSRSALAKAMTSMVGSTTTVGIVPNLNVSQQLIFLLNVPQSKMSTMSGSNAYEMKLLYNSHVIEFENGTEGLGLDFAAYNLTAANWSISSTPSYQTDKLVSQKYFDNFTGYQASNTHKILRDSMNNSLYGIFRFQCGISSLVTAANAATLCGGDCIDQCQIFRGFTYADMSAGVISMRRVTFPTNYHSPLYADTNTLDFVISFMNGGVTVSSTLINAYTVESTNMANIKAAYVNYYDDSVISNKGVRIPMMIRIGGAALLNQSLDADVVSLFFDMNTESLSFQPQDTYDIGCSTASCHYYPSLGMSTPQDIWVNSQRVDFMNLPPLINEFNLLVPVTQKLNTAPSSLTIAFMKSNYSVGDVGGLLRVLRVYRLFGPAISKPIAGSIPSINSLMPTLPGSLNKDFNLTSWKDTSVSSFLYAMDMNRIGQSNNTIGSYGTAVSITPVNQYGASITITSLYYNIFGTTYMKNNVCTYFSYMYYEQEAGVNLQRTDKEVHVTHCPIDNTTDLSTNQGDIFLQYPQYPNIFVSGFPLQTAITYGLSNPAGRLLAYKQETGTVTTIPVCNTYMRTLFFPNTPGKQRTTFTVSFRPIFMDTYPKSYNSFKINIQFPASVLTALTILTTGCDSLNPLLTCSISAQSALIYDLLFTYTGSTQQTFTQLDFSVYGISSTLFSSIGNYTLTIWLPQYASASTQLFGSDYTVKTTLATCTAVLGAALTPLSSRILLSDLRMETVSQKAKSIIQFTMNFDFRQVFFSSSILKISLGFLQSPSIWRTRANMFCSVYDQYGMSTLWKAMDYSTYPNIMLYPKTEIPQPSNLTLTLKCVGGAIPDTIASAQNVGAIWLDNNIAVETSQTNITFPTNLTTIAQFTPAIVTKRFNNPGMLSFYIFMLTVPTAITTQSRIYLQFPYAIPNSLNNNKQVECYMRLTNGATNDLTSTECYCSLYEQSRIVIYVSMAVSAATTIYLDVFSIQQPLSLTATSFITLSLDVDSNFTNGIHSQGEVVETPIGNQPTNIISILSISCQPMLLQSVQNVSIRFSTTAVIPASIYVLLPSGYADWNTRGSNLTCSLSDGTELAQLCQFISRRVIRVDAAATTSLELQLTLFGLTSPFSISDEFQEALHFNIFTVSDSSQVSIQSYSFDRLFNPVSLISSTSVYSLYWDRDVIVVYQGYYRNTLSLLSTDYPNPYRITFNFTVANPLLYFKPYANANLGTTSTVHRLAADVNTLPSMYTLQFVKTNDTSGLYSLIPPLKAVVSATVCQLTTVEAVYTLPVGGNTLPIIINASQCIPVDNITISMTFSSFSSELQAVNDLSKEYLRTDTTDGLYYFVVMHTPGSMTASINITASFQISGPQAVHYVAPTSIILSTVSLDTSVGVPIATSPTIIGDIGHQMTFQMQCNLFASTVYWAVGVSPTVISMTALDIQARIISDGNGYKYNFTEPNDPYHRIYGVNYNNRPGALIEQTASELKSNSQYQFKYFCVDQLGRPSQGQTINFTSFNTGSSLMKMIMLFNESLTYGQINDLSCTVSLNLLTPYDRLMTSAMSSCYRRLPIFYPNQSTLLIEPIINSTCSYGVYVLPDMKLVVDDANSKIRQILLKGIALNQANLPRLISLTTYSPYQLSQDVFYSTLVTPTMDLISIKPNNNGAFVQATLNNMNGFILVAMMKGLFYPNMTKPSTVNIKQGYVSRLFRLFNEFLTLDAVQMQYSPLGATVNFTISTLLSDADYTLYYFCTVDDPQFSALSGEVYALNITTLPIYTITVDWAGRLLLTICLGLLIF